MGLIVMLVTGWQTSKPFFVIKESAKKFILDLMTHHTVFLQRSNSKLGDSPQNMKGAEKGTGVPKSSLRNLISHLVMRGENSL